jgi:hypothetical protein
MPGGDAGCGDRSVVDAQIDSLVYGIYGLEPAEIAIVESEIGKTANES